LPGRSTLASLNDRRGGTGTANEETLGLYREGDSDGAFGVKGLRGLLDLSEVLSADHDGETTVIVDDVDPSSDHLRPVRRAEKALRETEGRPFSIPYARTSL
jgi:hypothetical protein